MTTSDEYQLPQGACHVLRAIAQGIGLPLGAVDAVRWSGAGALPSVFAVSDLAAGSVAAAAVAMGEWVVLHTSAPVGVQVDRRLSSLWFGSTLKPQGWTLPPPWDAIAGDYPAADGWIRLHTNAPHHRAAALAALGFAPDVLPDKATVARAVATWAAVDLESAVVAHKGCAAAMRTAAQWASHPQARHVNAEPLVTVKHLENQDGPGSARHHTFHPERPLQGVRVLDLTRVLAGPVATRFLAGFGAEVLRIDPLNWDEPGVVPEVTVGKRCARLDLRSHEGRDTLVQLLRSADVLVHGYRADALERLGLGAQERQAICPGLVDVSLNAYGATGPWRDRRGFDSLVQMSTGIAHAGMQQGGKDRPTPLPVQALDHATGYVMAAAVVKGLSQRWVQRDAGLHGWQAHTSLARVAELLVNTPVSAGHLSPIALAEEDWSATLEPTDFGPAHRLRPPLHVAGLGLRWERGACRLGSAPAEWLASNAK